MTSQSVALLPNPTWRGIMFPWTGQRDHGFSHDSEKHRYLFRDQQLIESLGRQNPFFRYKIPFFDTVRPPEESRPLFREVYPEFYAACLDRSPGELVDPIHGAIQCKLVALQETADIAHLSGVYVTAEFVAAPDEPDDSTSNFQNIARSLPRLEQQARQLDSEIRDLTPSQMEYVRAFRQQSSRGDLNIISAIRATVSSVSRARDQLYGMLAGAANQLEYVRSDIENALDPQLEVLRRDAGRLALGALDASRQQGNTRIVTVEQPIGRVAFAAKYGIDLDELIAWNPILSSLITIPKGTQIRVPRAN